MGKVRSSHSCTESSKTVFPCEYRSVETYHYYDHSWLIWGTEFFVLFWDDLKQKCHASRQYMKWEYAKMLLIISFSCLPI